MTGGPAPPSSSAASSASVGTPVRKVAGITAAVLVGGISVAWMAGRLFTGGSAWLLAVTGLIVGTAPVAAAHRRRPPSAVQAAAMPAAVVVGTVVALLASTPHPLLGHLPRLVGDSLRSGNLGGARAAPLDAGWRFLLVAVFAVVGAAAVSLALNFGRARLGVALCFPLLFGAALSQPAGRGAVAGVGSVVALMAAVGIAAHADSSSFPTGQGGAKRRSALGAVTLLVLAASVAGVSRVGSLFPSTTEARSGAPRPGGRDAERVVFRVRSDQPGPWRLEVFDSYSDGVFSASADASEPQPLGPAGSVPGAIVSPTAASTTATFTIVDLGGRVLPSPANPVRVSADGLPLDYEQRTQLLGVAGGIAPPGAGYTVTALPPPTPDTLRQAPPPPAGMRTFTFAPSAPPEVTALLVRAPSTSLWDRLQFALSALADHVVTASRGGGAPPVPPVRVAEMLAGAQASPPEITAAEALLARWAGVPSRVAVGYFGAAADGRDLSLVASQKVSWVEVYFEGLGWVPVIGSPGPERPSVSAGPGQASGIAVPDSRQLLTLYVPVQLRGGSASVDLMRYWTLFALVVAVAGSAVWFSWPGPKRAARRLRRRRWAKRRGPAAGIAVAYADFRDACTDLEVGRATTTPLDHLGAVEADEEHTELAWLVTRALWGDMRRDLHASDADAAEAMARSVTRRLRRALPTSTRLLAVGSRASLRRPYTTAVPTRWSGPEPTTSTGDGYPSPKRTGAACVAALAVLALVAAGLAAVAGRGPRRAPSVLPPRVVPDGLGPLSVRREPTAEAELARTGRRSLASDARVFTLRDGVNVRGYLEVAALRPGVDVGKTKERLGILRHLASGQYQPQRTPQGRVYVGRLRDQTFRIWFSPSGRLFELFVAGPALGDGAEAFGAVLDYQQTGRIALRPGTTPSTLDRRQGGDAS